MYLFVILTVTVLDTLRAWLWQTWLSMQPPRMLVMCMYICICMCMYMYVYVSVYVVHFLTVFSI